MVSGIGTKSVSGSSRGRDKGSMGCTEEESEEGAPNEKVLR